jgi:hypothetical protein
MIGKKATIKVSKGVLLVVHTLSWYNTAEDMSPL